MAAEHDGAVASVSRKRNTGRTGFRGVCRVEDKYRARIWEPRWRALTYLGSFDTAEEAGRAYAAAAVRLRLYGTARAPIPSFRQRKAASDDDADAPLQCVSRVDKGATAGSCSGQDAGTPRSAKKTRKKKTAARPEAWTKFRGVHQRRSGRYGAQIKSSKGEARWLGGFIAAEEAARAYDAAAVKLHGAAAQTNFKVGDDGVYVQAARTRTGFRGVYEHQSGRYYARIWDSAKRARVSLGTFDRAEDAATAYDAEAVRLRGDRAITNFKRPGMDLDGSPQLGPLDFFSGTGNIIPDTQVDDLWTDLPQPELQPVDELLHDIDFTGVAA